MEVNESNPFFLTRSASLDLLEIEEHSLKKWGEIQTETYISLLYERFHYLANNPKTGNSWKYRADPFMMASAGEHFIIYEPFKELSLLHCYIADKTLKELSQKWSEVSSTKS